MSRRQETEAARDREGMRLTVLWGFANLDLSSLQRQATWRGKLEKWGLGLRDQGFGGLAMLELYLCDLVLEYVDLYCVM